MLVIISSYYVLKTKTDNNQEKSNVDSQVKNAFTNLPGSKPNTENVFKYDSENSNDNIEFKVDNAEFELKRKVNSIETELTVTIGTKVNFTKNYKYAVNSITKLEFGDHSIVVINYYSGGAHCCSVAIPYLIKKDGVYEGKELYLGNNDVFGEDNFFVKDNRLFALTVDDRFAYYEMSFVESGIMGFPSYYELSIQPFGFENINRSFSDIYENMYSQSQNESKSLINKDICNKDEVEKASSFGLLVRRYSLGYFAGRDREALKNELNIDWWCFTEKNIDKIENEIWKKLNNDK